MYLLDANVLIRAHEDYYPIDRVPQFWDWLVAQGTAGTVKMPFEIHDEIASASGPVKDWIVLATTKAALLLEEEADSAIFNRVLAQGYAPDLNDAELEEVGRDPFLVSYALAATGRVVVTREVSATSKLRGRRKVPDVCQQFGVRSINDFQYYRECDFRIAP